MQSISLIVPHWGSIGPYRHRSIVDQRGKKTHQAKDINALVGAHSLFFALSHCREVGLQNNTKDSKTERCPTPDSTVSDLRLVSTETRP